MSGRLAQVLLGVLLALVGSASVAAATTRNSTDKGVTYRWTDEQGAVHYGDRIPPQYAQKEGAVLNKQGVEVRRLEAQKSAAQLAAEERAQQDVNKQKQHDAFLVNTYTSVQDIEALRDLRLDQLRGQKVAAQQYVDTVHSRLSALQKRAKLFKPYSSRSDAHRLPDDVAEDLIRALNELRTQRNLLATKTEEEAARRAQFQSDIERYRELHAAHN
jgi:hypothetical protein